MKQLIERIKTKIAVWAIQRLFTYIDKREDQVENKNIV